MIYTIIALGLGTLSLIEILLEKKVISTMLMIAICIFLIIINGTRTWGGDDLIVYENYYQNLSLAKLQYGIGFETLVDVSNKLGLNFKDFIFGTAFFIIPIQLIFFVKSTKFPVTATFIFFMMGFIWLDQILVRQSLAACFILISVMCYLSGRRYISMVGILCASLFHASALIAYTFWEFINKFKKTRFGITLLTIIVLSLISNSYIYDIVNEYIHYISPNILNYIENNEGIAITKVIDFIVALILYLVGRRNYTVNENNLYSGVFFISGIILLISYKISAATRFLEYSNLFYAVVIARYFYKKPIKSKIIIFLFFYIYAIARIYYFTMVFDGGLLMKLDFKI